MSLKPCPCCGSRRIFDVTRGDGWGPSVVGCMDCGLEVEGRAPSNERGKALLAKEKWNLRNKPKPLSRVAVDRAQRTAAAGLVKPQPKNKNDLTREEFVAGCNGIYRGNPRGCNSIQPPPPVRKS